jgi:hypothetical protein
MDRFSAEPPAQTADGYDSSQQVLKVGETTTDRILAGCDGFGNLRGTRSAFHEPIEEE